MVQGDDPLEVNSESDRDKDENISYDELAMVCQDLFEKYELMKSKTLKLKKENVSF